jgi:hypothetical protein
MTRNSRRQQQHSSHPAGRTPPPAAIGWLLAAALVACAQGDGERAAVASSDGDDLPICDLLTDDQVSSVLPGHDGGFVAASGASLMEGVKSYQCSYSATRGEGEDLLTVILTVGSDVEQFNDWIKPGRSAKQEIHEIYRDLEVADGGMLYGEPDDMNADAWQGTTLVSLELMAPDAERRSEALAALAAAVVAKLE